MKSNHRSPLFIILVTLMVIIAIIFLIIGLSIFLTPKLKADWQIWLFWTVGIMLVVMGALANLAQFSGYSIKELFVRKNEFVNFTREQNQRNREILLTRIWTDWIEGVLKKSLYNEVRIELGLELQPEAVAHPWNTVLQTPEQAPIRIPTHKKILDVFNESSKSLVILGEPGSGKTTELLELAHQVIECAKKYPVQHIPVVFNLSTWTPKQNIQDWLVNELWERYKISSKLGRYWVTNNELMFLLDGLDEVKSEYRNQCVQAINNFLKEHLSPIVICCRKNEFETFTNRINVHSVILIQPLSSGQVIDYLQIAGSGLVAIYNQLKIDSGSESQDFIHTPLMLSILILAYQDASAQEIESLLKSTNYRKHLFDFYINQMFKRRRKSHIYTDAQTKKWLAWLASRMMENGLSQFYIENIQPNWLGSVRQEQNYKLLKIVFMMLFFGLIVGLITGLKVGPIGGLIFGLSSGLIAGVGEYKKPVYKLVWSWSVFKHGLSDILIVGLILGLIGGLGVGLITWLKVGLIVGLKGGLITGLIGGLIGGLTIGLIVGLIVGLNGGLSTGEIEIHDKPDQSLRNSLINFLIFGLIFELIFGPIFGLIGGLDAGLSGRLTFGLIVGLIFGLIFGLYVGLDYGGGFLISHFLLRWQLYRVNKIPLKLIKFLNFAAERVFLRKVGGGYIFLHRMVMEHFAEMDKTTSMDATEIG